MVVNTSYFLALSLIFIRITAFLLVSNVVFPRGTPVILKGSFSLILAYGVITGIDYNSINEINNNFSLIFAVISEVMTGFILAFVVNMIFEFIKMAGSFMDTQAGLSMVSLLDPTTNSNTTLMSNFLMQISMVLFFIVDGHHLLIKLLIKSFKIVPVGETIVYKETLMEVIHTFTDLFVVGVKIALPFIIVIFIADLCMALVSRTVPAINVMILGMPVKMLVGMLTFIAILPITFKIIIGVINDIPNIFQNIFKASPAIPLVFLIASEEKTEEATPKKKSEAKKKGQIARSKDVGLALGMLTCTLCILIFGSYLVQNMKDILEFTLQAGMLEKVNDDTLKIISLKVIVKMGLLILPIAIPIMIAGVIANLMQTGFILTGEPLKVQLSKLNPINGFKNMFSKRSAVDLVKNITVVAIVGILGYTYVKSNYSKILQISNLYLPTVGKEIQSLILGIFLEITIVLIILAALDYFIQFRFHQKDLRMSKQEIKEEFKQMEGDPQIKGKIKQKQREMATRRMMQSVADATVVITNPTHIAIALKYDESKGEAPVVVAKGADYIAIKIKELAKENNVPIMENKPLARLMFDQVEIDQQIPGDMYQAVAEILAMVYKMKNKI